MSNLKVNTINDANGTSNAVLYGVAAPTGSMGFRNRLINSDMRIDQRNAGASVTVNTNPVYTVDRWYGGKNGTVNNFTAQRSTTAPAGFSNSLLITAGTGVTPATNDFLFLSQAIEGFNFADLGWGTAGAQTITISFRVRSSLTGTFGMGLRNGAANRSYIASYTINAANTWEDKTVTIPGDTTGTWATDNTQACGVFFDIGNGSNFSAAAGSWQSANLLGGLTGGVKLAATTGATFYITGVQLEAGTNASPFERRDYGRELMMCQRYLPAFISTSTNDTLPGSFFGATSTAASGAYTFMVRARVRPTGITVSAGSHFTLTRPSTGSVVATAVNYAAAGTDAAQLEFNTASGLVADQSYFVRSNNASAYILFTGCEL